MATELIKNEQVIDALKRGTKRLNDGGGLYLLPFAGKAGHYWRLDYQFEGLHKTLSLGTHPEVDLATARARASQVRAQLVAGMDPSRERRNAREAAAQIARDKLCAQKGLPLENSFEGVARRWFAVKQGQWMESYSSKVIRRLELHAFPKFGRLSLPEITPKLVLDACRVVEGRDTLETAHRVRELCSAVFRFAIAEGTEVRDPCQEIRDALKRPPVRHFPALTKPPELAVLLRAIENYGGTPTVRSALKLSPLLMVRPGELRLASWDEFDLDHGIWYVPSMRMKRTKVHKIYGEPHLVPLAKQAVQILEELFKVTGQSGRVFPSEIKPGKFISENTLNKALRLMGFPSSKTTMHGFRATARTLAVEMLQIPESVIEAQLAHEVSDANGRAYNRTEFIKLRINLMQEWADWLDSLRDGHSTIEHPVLPEFTPVSRRLNSPQQYVGELMPDTNKYTGEHK